MVGEPSVFMPLFLLIQSFTGGPVLDAVMLFFADALAFLIPLTLIYLWFDSREGRRDSLFTFGVAVAGISLTYALALFYFHNQPFATYDTVVSGGELDNAFPSQHTASMFSVFWSFLYLKRKRLAALFGLTGLLTGLGRVFVGYHYPVDIIGGIFSGLLGLAVVAGLDRHTDLVDETAEFSYSIERRIREFI